MSPSGLSLVDCRWYNYVSKDDKRGSSGDRVDALSRDERLPVFYKRDVMVACEPSEPLTWGSKTVYANLYRVFRGTFPLSGIGEQGRQAVGWGKEGRRKKYEYVFYIAALNGPRR